MSFVLGVDVGTSAIRCVAVNKKGETLVQSRKPIHVEHPTPDKSEIDPEGIWQAFKDIVVEVLRKGSLRAEDADSLAITCQRGSFMLWNRRTWKPLTSIITWQDRRSAPDCKAWNESWSLALLQNGAKILHFFTRSKRFMAASVIHFITTHVAPRLYHVLNELDGAREKARSGELCFGTLESWILWKLTNGAVHATDYSLISSTVLYDTYQLSYSSIILTLFDIPHEMLPEVKDSGGLFGFCAPEIFGAEIPIMAVVSDQSSSVFSQLCWEPGDMKCTLGTGTFMCINTADHPHASVRGLYPLVGWKIGSELVYIAEGMFSSTGSVVDWGKKFGLYEEPSESETIAQSVEDSGGVYFVPTFDGIQAPHNDPNCAASVIGITHKTRQEHIVCAMLKSFAFVLKQLFDVAEKEVEFKFKRICVDGGVSNNDFVVQLASDLVGIPIERPTALDKTVYGAVFIAGLSSGFWKSKDEVRLFWELDKVFVPTLNVQKRQRQLETFHTWQRALQRSLDWYSEERPELNKSD